MRLLILLLLFPFIGFAQFGGPFPTSNTGVIVKSTPFVALSGYFNLSLNARTLSGSTNVAGDPKTGVRSATDGNGVTLSSIATINWLAYSGASAAQNISGTSTANTYFTALATSAFQDCWYNYTQFRSSYHVDTPHIRLSGLNPAHQYEIKVSWTRGSLASFDGNPSLMYVKGSSTAVGPSDGLNASVTTQPNGYVFSGQTVKVYPDSNGYIFIYLVTSTTADFVGASIVYYNRTL